MRQQPYPSTLGAVWRHKPAFPVTHDSCVRDGRSVVSVKDWRKTDPVELERPRPEQVLRAVQDVRSPTEAVSLGSPPQTIVLRIGTDPLGNSPLLALYALLSQHRTEVLGRLLRAGEFGGIDCEQL